MNWVDCEMQARIHEPITDVRPRTNITDITVITDITRKTTSLLCTSPPSSRG